MQFEITDAAAIIFAQVLYEAVADGYPLDAATAEARKAIYAARNLVEWALRCYIFARRTDTSSMS
jgi:hypothetical protein